MRQAILLTFLTLAMSSNAQEKKMLVYIADPMCSWCYGFTKEITKIKKIFENDLQFGMIMGGLRPYNKEVMDEKLVKFLREHWEDIGKKTGQSFRYNVLNWENFQYDTEPAARAVVVARSIVPAKEFDYFKHVQNSFYALNQHPHDVDTYVRIARDLAIDATEFEKRFLSQEYMIKTSKDFELSRKLGINGFPSLLLVVGEKSYIVVTSGYSKAAPLIAKIQEVLDEAAQDK